MPLILTSRTPWRRRPSGLVEIDRGSQQARQLNALWVPLGGTMRDLAGSSQASASSDIARAYDVTLGESGTFSGDYVTVPSSALLQPPLISIAAWVRPDTIATDTTILKKDSSYIVRQNNSSGIKFYLWAGSFIGIDSPSGLVAGVPIHVVCTFDGATQRIYQNGREVGTGANTGTVATSTNNVGIGAQTGGGEAWGGLIADVRVYSRALSASEVWSLYAPDTRWSLYQPIIQRRCFDLGSGGGTTYNESLTFAASAALTHAAAATASATTDYAATASVGQAGAATAEIPLAYALAASMAIEAAASASASVGLSASAALAQAAVVTSAAGVTMSATAALAHAASATSAAAVAFAATAAQSHAVTCVVDIATTIAATAALAMSDGSTQVVNESVSFTAAATHSMAATAIAEAVQTYLASTGLTHATAATAGEALGFSAAAALGHSVTAQAQAAITLSAAASLVHLAAADGDISYDIVRVAADTLLRALASGERLTVARPTAEDWQN